MSERYTSGAASITVDDAALVRHIDRVSQGAASQFIDVASKALEEVKTGAMARWPVREGHSRAGFVVRTDVTPQQIKVGIYNDAKAAPVGYAWFIKYSVRSPAFIEMEMRTIRRLADEADAHVARVTHRPHRRRLFREKIAELVGASRLSATAFGGSGAEVVKNYAAEMADRHGKGAPDDLQGKRAWTKMVRSPARKAAPKVIETLREQLTRLAREA
jgi:hypothetical protein